MSQARDPDPWLRQAVSRLLAERAAAGQGAPSAAPGAYSQARRRRPEGVRPRLARHVGAALRRRAPEAWRWKGRDGKLVDGTTVSLPATAANQAASPQPGPERPGLGFPLARLVAVFALAVGTVLDAAVGPFAGTRTGEPALFRRLHDRRRAGDVILADRSSGSYCEVALLQERGLDVVLRWHQRRPVDCRTGRRLGQDDHRLVWKKPKRPEWLDEASYARLPGTLEVREARLRGTRPGLPTQTVVVVTTLRDAEAVPRRDLTDLYRLRWHGERDLRSRKETLRMGLLGGKTPAMVPKELWAHFLAYNLIRTVRAQAAAQHDLEPRHSSFQGALQTVAAFAAHILVARRGELPGRAARLRTAIAQHRVADRPDRYAPRARKRRYDNFMHLRRPRAEAKALLLKGVCEEFK